MKSQKIETGFTTIEIITVITALSVLLAIGIFIAVKCQKYTAMASLKANIAELNTRETMAWFKYKKGSLTWAELQNPGSALGPESYPGNLKFEGDKLLVPEYLKKYVHIDRVLPTEDWPGSWKVSEGGD